MEKLAELKKTAVRCVRARVIAVEKMVLLAQELAEVVAREIAVGATVGRVQELAEKSAVRRAQVIAMARQVSCALKLADGRAFKIDHVLEHS